MEWTLWQRVHRRARKKRGKESDWIVRGAYYLPQGPWLNGSSFRRLPTKHPWRKSCAPHNNTTAPGHPHTGNLRSLPPFQGIQTHSCCQPRAPTAYWRGRWLKTRIQQKNIWIMMKYTAKTCDFTRFHCVNSAWESGGNTKAERVPISLFFGLTCSTDVMFF